MHDVQKKLMQKGREAINIHGSSFSLRGPVTGSSRSRTGLDLVVLLPHHMGLPPGEQGGGHGPALGLAF